MTLTLVVDDDVLVRKTVSALLRHVGHSVVVAEDGRDAIKKFGDGEFVLVITDILMPESDGLDLIKQLRKRSPEIKILAMSGGGRTGNMEFLSAATELGASATIEKPFTREEFMTMVGRLLSDGTQVSALERPVADHGDAAPSRVAAW